MAQGAVINHLHFHVYLRGNTECHNYKLSISMPTAAILQLLMVESVILGLIESVRAYDQLQE